MRADHLQLGAIRYLLDFIPVLDLFVANVVQIRLERKRAENGGCLQLEKRAFLVGLCVVQEVPGSMM